MNYIGWLILFVVFAVLELISLGLTCIWFAVGALAGCITALITDNWIIQSIVFIIVTVVVLIFLRPIAVKYINNKAEKTNVDSLIGKKAKVSKKDKEKLLANLEKEMREAAKVLDFERAAELRDILLELRNS